MFQIQICLYFREIKNSIFVYKDLVMETKDVTTVISQPEVENGNNKPQNNMLIPFNQPFIIGNELKYIEEAVLSRKISGDGMFSKKCHQYFEKTLGYGKSLLTTSCTDALELAALLIDIKPGDEIIAPSFTFVSTVNAFLLRGAIVKFVDSNSDNPNMNMELVEELISPKTKAIIPVHYAGIACDMDKLLALSKKYNIKIVEDAAQALDAFHISSSGITTRLGKLGEISAFSFHETKNVIAGEGGMIVINSPEYVKQAEILREKGTNRSAFFRGEVDKYGWVDVGSSFLPSELVAAYLYAQLEELVTIQNRRMSIWNHYHELLAPLGVQYRFGVPQIPAYAIHNAHMYYIITKSLEERDELISFLKKMEVNAVFHYQSLHASTYFSNKHDGRSLPMADKYSNCLLRLPFFYNLTSMQVIKVVEAIESFYKSRTSSC